ncbi:hypothetical protein R1sor_013428 [Riccia sorocarpa]|uniref:Uncharacterized protein n=1 Tax=Riccia sorocarpa TaxID=122646 RepID=A0ABD3H9C2_9MARC
MHTGYYIPNANSPPSSILEIRSKIRILPPQENYYSTLRCVLLNNIAHALLQRMGLLPGFGTELAICGGMGKFRKAQGFSRISIAFIDAVSAALKFDVSLFF